MRKALVLLGSLALVAPSLQAQTVRWNDRPANSAWTEEAPRVRLWIDGSRAVSYGEPMRIRFEVSDNAYVTVVRVDDDGRMTILFPYSRNQRAAVRGNIVHDVRSPRLGGNYAFVSTDRMSGYVFAIASYAPLDFSRFENRDYDRVGGYSRFTLANRSIARRPDVFIDRFAAAVLWDTDTPYDYDVDYYHPIGYQGAFNTFAMCRAGGYPYFIGWRTYLAQFSTWDRVAYPMYFNSMCGDMYYRLRCYSSLALYSYAGCNMGRVAVNQPGGAIPGQPVDSTVVPNEGVVRGGLFAPTPVPVPVEGGGTDAPPVERPAGRFDQVRLDGELDDIMSIPARATRKMKEDDARRAGTEVATPPRAGFDRADVSSKPEKRTADAEGVTRVQPPSRQPTKAKGTSEPRRETGSKGGFGTTSRPSEPRSTQPDRVRVEARGSGGTGSANPPSIQGTTTEKKKPPQE